MKRADGRKSNDLRKVNIVRNYLPHAEGSVLFELGNTRVICTASAEDKVPQFLQGTGQGWITAEYAMLPRSTTVRTPRASTSGRVGGRTHEIQRLIGRSLRAVADLEKMLEITIWMDCDVIQADGGTRTAAITGAFIALFDALKYLLKEGKITKFPLREYVAATSVGIVNGVSCLDLCCPEDVSAQVDMNVVMSSSGKFVEIQGTAEKHPFSKKELDKLLKLAEKGVRELIECQKSIIGEEFEELVEGSNRQPE